MQYLLSAIKQSTIKQGMPVLYMTMKKGNDKCLSVKKWKTKMWYGLIIKHYMALINKVLIKLDQS